MEVVYTLLLVGALLALGGGSLYVVYRLYQGQR